MYIPLPRRHPDNARDGRVIVSTRSHTQQVGSVGAVTRHRVLCLRLRAQEANRRHLASARVRLGRAKAEMVWWRR